MPRKPKAPHVVFGKGKAVIANALLPNRCALQWYSPMHCQNCGELFPMPAGLMEWCTAVMNAINFKDSIIQLDQTGQPRECTKLTIDAEKCGGQPIFKLFVPGLTSLKGREMREMSPRPALGIYCSQVFVNAVQSGKLTGFRFIPIDDNYRCHL